jgi:hypothetical protein
MATRRDWHFEPGADLRQATVGNAKLLRDP